MTINKKNGETKTTGQKSGAFSQAQPVRRSVGQKAEEKQIKQNASQQASPLVAEGVRQNEDSSPSDANHKNARKLPIAILISGRGSNLQAIIDACADPAFPAVICTVISNIPGAYGLTRAEKAGIPTATIPHKDYPSRESFEAALHQAILDSGAEFVCLAGFMRLLTPGFTEQWEGRMINIHPSLLPEFKGLDTHARAIEAGAEQGGCTVHYVVPEMDAGPIILQAPVKILPDDTAETLAARVLEKEHIAYPLALRLIAEGHATLQNGRVTIDTPLPDGIIAPSNSR